ncbi:MAG: hypothetical protein H0Z39_08805 [Peptococcaceae bacterium]|nr:hypothetical protein [Peptococcaceae bacterium]
MYLIPRNVVTRFEFFTGFGWFELIAVAVGGLIGLVLFKLTNLLGVPSLAALISGIVPPAAAFFVTRPTAAGGESLFVLLQRGMQWGRSPKRYLYFRREI